MKKVHKKWFFSTIPDKTACGIKSKNFSFMWRETTCLKCLKNGINADFNDEFIKKRYKTLKYNLDFDNIIKE